MAITTAMCNSFKEELLGGVHDLDSDVIKIALIKATPSGTYGAGTTNYSDVTANTDEAVGTNYIATGNTLTSPVISLDGSAAIVDFADTAWASSTVSADGCILYNSTRANRAIAVIDFGGTKTSTNGDFVIQMPTADASNAIIRIA
jgi:hypothetical protein